MTDRATAPNDARDLPGTDVIVVALPNVGDGARHLAIPGEVVREVARLGPVTRYPGAPIDVPGLTAVRGQIVPVVDVTPPGAPGAHDSDGAAGRTVILLAAGARLVALAGASPLRVARMVLAPTHADEPPRAADRVALWSGRVLPVSGTARLPEDSRRDAAGGSALPVLDVAALVHDVIDESHGGR